MSSQATMTTLTLGVAAAVAAAAVLVTRQVAAEMDAAICAASDDITLDHDA